MTEASLAKPAPSIWTGSLRPVTVGSILAVTIIAFQGLALATIAPILADDIGGRDLYGWIFSAFLIPQIIGTVLGGLEVDRRSPAVVFGAFLILFGLGCILAGSAPSIGWFFAGRALQGFGAGGLFASVYAVIALAYQDRLRPAMMAATSSAWIVPSLIGPAIAGFIAEQYTWRLVFYLLIPVLLVVAPLTLPAYHRMHQTRPPMQVGAGRRRRLAMSAALALSTGVFLIGLELNPVALAALVTIAGLGVLFFTLRHLMPEGTLTARPMLPAAIFIRSLCFGAFIVSETYMVFALKEFGGISAATAGLVLTAGSLSWTSGSWIQARWENTSGAEGRPLRALAGLGCLLAGIGVIYGTVALTQDIWIGVAIPGWIMAGLGMGLAYPTTSLIALGHAGEGSEGKVSSSILLGDLFISSTSVGLGGVLLAFGLGSGWDAPVATTLAMSLGYALLLVNLWATLRMLRAAPAMRRAPA
ncbi:MAG: MFS transporter [Chloroflexota bacterium]|nr:MFS transporter [Chloroflexota bacterium]